MTLKKKVRIIDVAGDRERRWKSYVLFIYSFSSDSVSFTGIRVEPSRRRNLRDRTPGYATGDQSSLMKRAGWLVQAPRIFGVEKVRNGASRDSPQVVVMPD